MTGIQRRLRFALRRGIPDFSHVHVLQAALCGDPAGGIEGEALVNEVN
eukprot:CAMPEP_0174943916 /NCGR_PEP_ID=MMETSP1355-20121228/77888_1 /TAXON_ID=464990 /ORGANISM="Hemiselmis tepida, Strain CCMP443" /LENGTH=47 /DNA_ID= /DNA_START= /DNA_END= /DNA_ORIENTATION=